MSQYIEHKHDISAYDYITLTISARSFSNIELKIKKTEKVIHIFLFKTSTHTYMHHRISL